MDNVNELNKVVPKEVRETRKRRIFTTISIIFTIVATGLLIFTLMLFKGTKDALAKNDLGSAFGGFFLIIFFVFFEIVGGVASLLNIPFSLIVLVGNAKEKKEIWYPILLLSINFAYTITFIAIFIALLN